MLRDIKLEDNENGNIERLALLINAQRKNHFVKYKQEIQKDTPELENLIMKAMEKNQWRLALLLLTSPCILSKATIKQLALNKHSIISAENLKSTTDYGQYILTNDSLLDIDDKTTNLSRLAYTRSGHFSLPARKYGYFSQQPIGALGKICMELKRRDESKDDKLKAKNSLIAENIIRCASIDAATGTLLSRQAIYTLGKLLCRYLDNPTSHSIRYNPLLILSEVVMLLMDKGYNKPLNKSDQIEQFYALKIFLDSPKVSAKANGCYRHKYGVHIAVHSTDLSFLTTIFHELTHALCKIIYNRTDTIYWEELQKLADALQKFYETSPDKDSTLNFFSEYDKEKHANEIFPRMVELYIQDPYNGWQTKYPYEIVMMMNRLFSHFIRDIAEFKAKLIELQAKNKWSRVAASKALADKDYETYFSIVTPALQSSMNEWPQFSSDSKLATMAVEKGFSFYSTNKFKKNILQMVLEDKSPNLDRGLDILEKIWEEKAEILPANLDVCDVYGISLLTQAIIRGRNPEFIKWLIEEAGVDVSIPDCTRCSAVDYAKLRGLVEIQKLIELYLEPGADQGVRLQ